MDVWQPALKLKLEVTIVLLGFSEHYPSKDDSPGVRSDALETALAEVLSVYDSPLLPHQVPSGGSATNVPRGKTHLQSGLPPSLHVRYDISYSVKHTGKKTHHAYLDVLADAAVENTGVDSDRHSFVVPLDELSHIETIALEEAGTASSPPAPTFGRTKVTMLVANPRRAWLHDRLYSQGLIRNLSPDGGGDSAGETHYTFVGPGNLRRNRMEAAATRGQDRNGDDPRVRQGICARSWVGRERVLVLDLGASTCEYGAFGKTDPRSTVTDDVYPSGDTPGNSEYWLRKEWGAGQHEGGPNPETAFNLKLSSLMVSAIRTVLAPAVHDTAAYGSKDFVIPVSVFRGDVSNDERNHEDSPEARDFVAVESVVDMTQVSNAMSAMALPEQEAVIVGAVHYLSEHPEVAVAFEKSLAIKGKFRRRSGTSHPSLEVHQEAFVDSDRLLFEMKNTRDTLASFILSDWQGDPLLRLDAALAAGDGLQSVSEMQKAGIRVLPIFVFSLESADGPTLRSPPSGSTDASRPAAILEHPGRLFQGNSAFAAEAGGDSVLVLHSEGSVPIPLYARSDTLQLNLANATQSVIGGLLQSVYGTTAPDRWWPPRQQNPVTDLSWAHGFHPFAPFGFGGPELGKLLVDTAHRNAVVSIASAVATTLIEAAKVLEEFAQIAVPNALLLGGMHATLSSDRAAMQGEWGREFETAATTADLPAHLISPALDVHRSLHDAVNAFERGLDTLIGASLAEAVSAMEGSRRGASSLVLQANDLAKTLGSWHCMPTPRSQYSHAPWILYLSALMMMIYFFGRMMVLSRRALLKYITSGRGGPDTGW